MVKGCFVVLEGGEGAGKSTQAALVAEWLGERGVPHPLAREPGSTGVGEAVREVNYLTRQTVNSVRPP